MTTDLDEAWDTLTDYLEAQWPTVSSAIVGTPVPLYYEDLTKPDIPSSHFARFSMQPVGDRQRYFKNGDVGQPIYVTNGVLYLQVFTLRSDFKAAELKRRLAVAGKALFRGKSFDGCIWTRNVRINWLDPEPKFLKANVVAEYQWDEQG